MKYKLIAILILMFFQSCSFNEEIEGKNALEKIINNTHYTYFSDGSPKSIKPFIPDTIYNSSDTSISRKINGVCVFYYAPGEMKSEVNYQKGLRHGSAKMYYETGELYVEEHYKRGVLHGEKTKYYTTGSPVIKSYYENGYHAKTSELYDFKGNKLPEPTLNYRLEDLRIKQNIVRVHFAIKNLKKIRKAKYYLTATMDNNITLHFELNAKKGIGFQDIEVPPHLLYVAKLNVVAKYTLSSGDVGGVVGNYNLVLRPLINY